MKRKALSGKAILSFFICVLVFIKILLVYFDVLDVRGKLNGVINLWFVSPLGILAMVCSVKVLNANIARHGVEDVPVFNWDLVLSLPGLFLLIYRLLLIIYDIIPAWN